MLPAWVTYNLNLHQPHVSNKNTSFPLYCLRMENSHNALLWDPLFWSNFDFSPLFLFNFIFYQFDLREFQVANVIYTYVLPLRTPKRLRHDGDTLRMDSTQVGILERWGRMRKSPKKWRRWEITLWKINMEPKVMEVDGSDDIPVQLGDFVSSMRLIFQGCRSIFILF